MQPRYLRKHCFGSLYLNYAKEMDNSFITWRGNKYELSKIADKTDFLKIGLFDIWLCNEDRSHKNFNLLINPGADGKYHFFAIDHTACFNSGNLHRGLALLTENDTILTAPQAKILFKRGPKLNDIVDDIVDDYYLCVSACHKQVGRFIDELPETWNLDKDELRTQLEQIFDKKWLHQCEQLFRQYIQTGIR